MTSEHDKVRDQDAATAADEAAAAEEQSQAPQAGDQGEGAAPELEAPPSASVESAMSIGWPARSPSKRL